MSTHAKLAQGAPTAPLDAITLGPKSWAETWADRPREDVCIGLRLVAAEEYTGARENAANKATKAFPVRTGEFVEAYNDALMSWVVARGLCDPNDVSRDWHDWQDAAGDQAATMAESLMRPEAIRACYDALERLAIATSPIDRSVDDAEVDELPFLFANGIDRLSPTKATRIRKLLAFAHAELEGATSGEQL